MKKQNLIICTLALLAIVAGGLYGYQHRKPSTDREAKTPAVETRTITDKALGQGYELQARYPQFTANGDDHVTHLNTMLESRIKQQIDQFKSASAVSGNEAEGQSELAIDYNPMLVTGQLVSIRFDDYSYSAGAAHPITYTEVFNYDLVADKEVTIQTLFKDREAALQTLSDKTRTGLFAKLNTDGDYDQPVFTDGTAPAIDNYKKFTLGTTGITFYFDPYQIAAYAAGPQEYTIAYKDLQTIINPNGPLQYLIK